MIVRKRQTMRLTLNETPLFMSGVVSCIRLEVLMTRASNHPILQDLYFLAYHSASAAVL